jgi:hypothetical protein
MPWMSENWERWENEVVNGIFPLRRSVRNSGHSAVYLTEHKSNVVSDAVLKLVPAIPTLKDAQLSHWSITSRLSHPCLVRLLDTGSCQLGGLNFLYVVTEYAEATLAQILAQRALEIEEFKRLVRPVLEGLSFLHRKQLVHGGLKPSNLLLFKERLKLASDAVRPAGESSASIAPASEFDAPESRDGSISPAGDIWSLGVLIVEALTQKRPVWPDKTGGPVLPKSLPASFVGLVLRCLNRNPARRPTVEELDAEINPMAPAYVAAERPWLPAVAFAPGPVVNELPLVREPPVIFPQKEVEVAPAPAGEPTVEAVGPIELVAANEPMVVMKQPPNRSDFLVRAAMVVVGLLGVAWGGAVLLSHQGATQAAMAQVTRPAAPSTPAQDAKPIPFAEPEAALAVTDPRSAVHEELPDVPEKALATIHGRMLFAIRVTVDPEGRIVHAAEVGNRSSKYFGRLCTEAAMRWKFAPAQTIEARKWLLHFEFTRKGVVARST